MEFVKIHGNGTIDQRKHRAAFLHLSLDDLVPEKLDPNPERAIAPEGPDPAKPDRRIARSPAPSPAAVRGAWQRQDER